MSLHHLSDDGFAKKLLKKHGWKEGDGLGKERNGITVPIKPSLKFDTAGVGHDRAQEFTSNWWDSAFNKAAQSLNIVQNEDGSVDVKTQKKVSKKQRKHAKRRERQKMYSQFVQSATLSNGTMINANDSSHSEDEEKVKESLIEMTDEELFKACGGLTAHKGARHGHKMSAKLKRLAEMEEKFLHKLENSTISKKKKKKI